MVFQKFHYIKEVKIMKGPFVAVVLIFSASVYSSCYDLEIVKSEKVQTEVRTDGVVKVFLHERCRYTYFVQPDENSGRLQQYTLDNCAVHFYADALPSKKGWLISKTTRVINYNKSGKIVNYGGGVIDEFHLHFGDFGGAGWNHGKFGHGRTIEIE